MKPFRMTKAEVKNFRYRLGMMASRLPGAAVLLRHSFCGDSLDYLCIHDDDSRVMKSVTLFLCDLIPHMSSQVPASEFIRKWHWLLIQIEAAPEAMLGSVEVPYDTRM
jgi:hypothetical protein